MPELAADTFLAVPDVDSTVARAQLLERLGLAAEARWEWDRLARASDDNPERLLATAKRPAGREGHASQAIQGSPDAPSLAARCPMPGPTG